MPLLHVTIETERQKKGDGDGWDGPHCPSARNPVFYSVSFMMTQGDDAGK